MYHKPHQKNLQKFSMVDVSQVAMCVSSQISERVTREGSFAKGFPMSSDSQNAKNSQMEAKNLFPWCDLDRPKFVRVITV
jgi:hypothetical protein